MARGSKKNTGDTSRFEDMSNTELIEYIGGDVDPNTGRADLIYMAIEVDQGRRAQ